MMFCRLSTCRLNVFLLRYTRLVENFCRSTAFNFFLRCYLELVRWRPIHNWRVHRKCVFVCSKTYPRHTGVNREQFILLRNLTDNSFAIVLFATRWLLDGNLKIGAELFFSCADWVGWELPSGLGVFSWNPPHTTRRLPTGMWELLEGGRRPWPSKWRLARTRAPQLLGPGAGTRHAPEPSLHAEVLWPLASARQFRFGSVWCVWAFSLAVLRAATCTCEIVRRAGVVSKCSGEGRRRRSFCNGSGGSKCTEVTERWLMARRRCS